MRKSLVLAASLALSCLVPAQAPAFCGFFVSGADAKLTNNASQVVLMRKGNRTVMTMSNTYQGPPSDFAMVVPVPVVLKKGDVKTLAPDVFDHIDQLSAPRLVEYWEQDPCYVEPKYEDDAGSAEMAELPKKSASGPAQRNHGVRIEAKFAVGEYEILILSAKQASGLETWLRENKYTIPKGAKDALAPYVAAQMKFFVAKVNIAKVRRDSHDNVVLSPLRFAFESPELRLPVRLGLLNAGAKQDLIVYVLHPDSRFEVSNYPNVFIPTNLEVKNVVRKRFGSFYAELFDQTMAQNKDKAVVTEYAWQTTSCDPCPVPPLEPSDLWTLGNDVITGGAKPNKSERSGDAQGGFFGDVAPWVLTRMHTRYDQSTLSEDLVFSAAKPVVGGRSQWDGTPLEAPGEVKPDSTNNFQGRYIIRHYWKGQVACTNPVYNRWGGPPAGADNTPKVARDLANAERGGVNLKKVVRSKLASLDLPGVPVPNRAKANATPGEKK